MYKNAGEKIFTLANILVKIMFALSIIGGLTVLVLMYINGDSSGILLGPLVAVLGCGVSWLLNLLLAGFGELVRNTHDLLDLVQGNPAALARGGKSASKSAKKNQAGQVAEADDAQASPIVRRAFISLEDSEWSKADELFEQALNMEPENAKAYAGKLCVKLRVNREEELQNYKTTLGIYSEYKKALRFADDDYRKILEQYSLTADAQKKED